MALTYVSLFVALVFATPSTDGDPQGRFWQLSDVHFDPQYSQHGDPADMCHYKTNSTGLPGFYGNYQCDSSWNLVLSAVEEMKSIEKTPDFILWTGDTVPHVDQPSVENVYSLISNVTRTLRDMFPEPISIVPVLGNHDAFPSNQMPLVSHSDGYYSDILTKGGWSSLLTSEEQKQFLQGGYYTRKHSPNLRFIVLNTNLWYSLNNKTKSMLDPNNQFTWLKRQLEEAQQQKCKVYIVAHICPGGFERLPITWFYQEYNRKYLSLVRKYHKLILAHFCGHEHTDSFRILTASDGSSSMMFLSPALTPWKSSLPGVGANNPSFRLFHFSKTTGSLQNYVQYYMNLTDANTRHDEKTSVWSIEYTPVSAFSLPDLSADSFSRMSTNWTETASMFRQYLQYNTVSYNMSPVCDRQCFLVQICATLNLDLDSYRHCISKRTETTPQPRPSTSTNHHHHKQHTLPRYVYYIIGAMGFVIVLLAIIVSCLCAKQKRRHGIPFKYGRFAGTIN